MIDIGHKYNYQKVLSIIVTEDTGITNAGIPYLSKYPEKNNFTIFPIARTIFMSELFGYVNEVESYQKPRRYALVLEK